MSPTAAAASGCSRSCCARSSGGCEQARDFEGADRDRAAHRNPSQARCSSPPTAKWRAIALPLALPHSPARAACHRAVRTLVHLSDLHFGRVDPRAPRAARRRACAQSAPHLVVVSGDLTQRAQAAQFREARRFLDALPEPQLVVPGNHDVPLYNPSSASSKPLAQVPPHIARRSSRRSSTTRSRWSASTPRARWCSRADASTTAQVARMRRALRLAWRAPHQDRCHAPSVRPAARP